MGPTERIGDDSWNQWHSQQSRRLRKPHPYGIPLIQRTRQRVSQAQPVEYPRRFSGAALSMISFPLGGVGAGSIGLGGRGQLRDWEIFNRPDRGNTPDYAFASIWAKARTESRSREFLKAALRRPMKVRTGWARQCTRFGPVGRRDVHRGIPAGTNRFP